MNRMEFQIYSNKKVLEFINNIQQKQDFSDIGFDEYYNVFADLDIVKTTTKVDLIKYAFSIFINAYICNIKHTGNSGADEFSQQFFDDFFNLIRTVNPKITEIEVQTILEICNYYVKQNSEEYYDNIEILVDNLYKKYNEILEQENPNLIIVFAAQDALLDSSKKTKFYPAEKYQMVIEERKELEYWYNAVISKLNEGGETLWQK